MEWCRMFSLRIIVCIVVLGCGLSIAVPDTRQDSSNSMTEREQKLQELLKSLEAYTTETHPVLSPVKNSSKSDLQLPMPSLPKHSEPQGPMVSGQIDETLPNEDDIRTYEEYYRIMYGTQEGVNLLRKHYGPTGLQRARANYRSVNRGMDELKLANAHFLRIRTRARCRVPAPQVIRVKDYYPDPSVEYLPRCTLLHRCGDTTGCCDSDAFHCVPSAIQEVELHFYTLNVGKSGLAKAHNSIEKLMFENHTACQCQPVNDLPRIQDGQNHLLDGTDPPSKSKCRECPMPFTSRIYKDGRCGCDCFDRQKPCIRIKRGREPIPEIERRCVEANHCHIPDCEYGQYNPDSGYCPRRHDEEPRTHPRRPNHLSQNHRWAFVERD